jgi:hypothetical protein
VRAGEEGDGMREYVEADGAAEVGVGCGEEERCWVAHGVDVCDKRVLCRYLVVYWIWILLFLIGFHSTQPQRRRRELTTDAFVRLPIFGSKKMARHVEWRESILKASWSWKM